MMIRLALVLCLVWAPWAEAKTGGTTKSLKCPDAVRLEKINSVYGGFCSKKNPDGTTDRYGAASIEKDYATRMALQRCQGVATDAIAETQGTKYDCHCVNSDSCGEVISCAAVTAGCGGKSKRKFDSGFCDGALDYCSGYEIKAARKKSNAPLESVKKPPAPTPDYIEGSNGMPDSDGQGRITPALEEEQNSREAK